MGLTMLVFCVLHLGLFHVSSDKPTNWGLRESTFKRQESENAEARRTHYVTSYSREFYPKEIHLEKRLAAPFVYVPPSEQTA